MRKSLEIRKKNFKITKKVTKEEPKEQKIMFIHELNNYGDNSPEEELMRMALGGVCNWLNKDNYIVNQELEHIIEEKYKFYGIYDEEKFFEDVIEPLRKGEISPCDIWKRFDELEIERMKVKECREESEEKLDDIDSYTTEEKKDWRTMSIPEKARAWNILIRIEYYGDSYEEAVKKADEDADWYRQSKSWEEHLQRYKQRYLNDNFNELDCVVWAEESYEMGNGYLCYMDAESFEQLMLNIEKTQPKED